MPTQTHFKEMYSCGKHVRAQCRCPDENKPSWVGDVACMECALLAEDFDAEGIPGGMRLAKLLSPLCKCALEAGGEEQHRARGCGSYKVLDEIGAMVEWARKDERVNQVSSRQCVLRMILDFLDRGLIDNAKQHCDSILKALES